MSSVGISCIALNYTECTIDYLRFRDATNDGNETKKEEIDSAAAAAVEDGAIKDDIQTSNVVDGETENSR